MSSHPEHQASSKDETGSHHTAGQMASCRCSDGAVVEVPLKDFRHSSHVFGNFCSNLGIDEGEDGDGRFEGEFNVPMESGVMRKVAEWVVEHAGKLELDYHRFTSTINLHYSGQPDPVLEEVPYGRSHFEFTDFEHHFLNVSIPEVVQLIFAALFFDIRSLRIYAEQRVAVLIAQDVRAGKTPAQIREKWGLLNDLDENGRQNIREKIEQSRKNKKVRGRR